MDLEYSPSMLSNLIALKQKSPISDGILFIITPEINCLTNIKQDEFFYFANSYYVPVDESTTAVTENQNSFSASLEKENYYGVQFHPEKSSESGLKVLQNFIEYL